METLLRCAQNWVQIKHPTCFVSDYIDDFFELAIKPYYKENTIISIRKIIRRSKELNQLLHDNTVGLQMIWNDFKIKGKGFNIDSARKLVLNLREQAEAYIPDVAKCFVYSKMTNLKDSSEPKKYFSLEYVEFLEMLCRIAYMHYANEA